MFNKDFDLFGAQTQAQPSRRAPSLDSTLPHLSNSAHAVGQRGNVHLPVGQIANSIQQSNWSTTRPPVPLFHSNSTGSIANQNSFIQQQSTTDLTSFTMGGGSNIIAKLPSSHDSDLTSIPDINVAYDGTFGDLSAPGDRPFDISNNYDFDELLSHGNGFTAINNGYTAHGATVSPRDIFNADSVPPSTTFTNLTTPGSSYIETPGDEYETSPLFDNDLAINAFGSENWYPLFSDDTTPAPASIMERTTSTSSVNQIMVHAGGEGNRKRRSTNLGSASPATFSPTTKHSTVAGVSANKRDKPLAPIVVDGNDTIALKRARNTAAARKSRAKKVQERDEQDTRIAHLEKEVHYWKSRALGRELTEEETED